MARARKRFFPTEDRSKKFPPLGSAGVAIKRSGGVGGRSQNRRLSGLRPVPKTEVAPRRPTTNRRRAPQNPHDPTSKDPFMRAGIGLGRNKTKIFKRAGMSMGG